MCQGGKYCFSCWTGKFPYDSRKNCFSRWGPKAFETEKQRTKRLPKIYLTRYVKELIPMAIAKEGYVKSFEEGNNVFLILVIHFSDNS